VTAVAMALAAAGALAPALVPVRCRVESAGVAVRGPWGWERRGWDRVRRVSPTRMGLLVSSSLTPRRLDRFRALALPISRRDRGVVLSRVRPHLDAHGL
jgi:hypothetical protein